MQNIDIHGCNDHTYITFFQAKGRRIKFQRFFKKPSKYFLQIFVSKKKIREIYFLCN